MSMSMCMHVHGCVTNADTVTSQTLKLPLSPNTHIIEKDIPITGLL